MEKRQFSHAYIVCRCKQVSLGELIYAIKERNATTLEELANLTEAGSCCGCCKTPHDDYMEDKMELYLSQILKKFVHGS